MLTRKLEELAFQESPAAQIVTEHRVIKVANRSFCSTFGYSVDQLIDDLTLKLYPDEHDYAVIGDRALSELRCKKTYQDCRLMRRKSGEIFRTGAHGITLSPGSPYALMIWSFEPIPIRLLGDALTIREREVACLVVCGFTCKEMARKLGISYRTVEVHRGHIMSKLHAKNSVDLAAKILSLRSA